MKASKKASCIIDFLCWYNIPGVTFPSVWAGKWPFSRKIKLLSVRLVKCIFFRLFCFELRTLTTPHFKASWPRKKFYYLKRKLCIVANECSFEIGRISVMRVREIKRVHPNLYGAPCTIKDEVICTCSYQSHNGKLPPHCKYFQSKINFLKIVGIS